MTQWDPVCDSPKFFVTQKVNRRPDFPTPSRSLSPSSQPDGPTGWGGRGEGKKRADCAKENRRDREMSRDRKWGETGRDGGRGDLVILQLRNLGGT